jgi:hypothetical protein
MHAVNKNARTQSYFVATGSVLHKLNRTDRREMVGENALGL